MYELSSAINTEYSVDIPFLRPDQKVCVEYVSQAKRVIIGDTMGLGKTLEALAVAEHLDLYPMLVICPAMLKLNWQKEVQKWFPHRSTEVISGQEGRYDSDITIINYDILADGWENKKKGWFQPSVHTTALSQKDLRYVVMDEGHYIKDKSAQRSRAVFYLAVGSPSGRAAGYLANRQAVEYRVWMSGTPILNRPSELIFPLEVLGRLKEMGGWHSFTNRYCAKKLREFRGKQVIDISGASRTSELNRRMRSSFYIRRTLEDIIENLPPLTYSNQYIEISNRAEYNRAKDDLIQYVGERALEDPEFLISIEGLSEDSQEIMSEAKRLEAQGRAAAAERLVLFSNLQRLTAEGKLQAAIDWIAEFLLTGESLIVVANHRNIVKGIADHFNAPRIMGGMSAKRIEKGKEAFQNEEEQLIVLNVIAGGVGHTLTAAHHICFVEFPFNPGMMDQTIQRAWGRMNDLHGVMVWKLIAENTLDSVILRMVEYKRGVVDEVTEGTE